MAFVSGSSNVEVVPWPGDDDYGGLPATLPTSVFPFLLNCPNGGSGLYEDTWNDGTWVDAYRGTVYLKLTNAGASSANINVDLYRATGGYDPYPWAETYVDGTTQTIDAGAEHVFEIDLSAWSYDLWRIYINANSATDVQIAGLQLTPFTSPIFWTNLKGVTEISE